MNSVNILESFKESISLKDEHTSGCIRVSQDDLNWLRQKLDESEKAMKEGRMSFYSLEEFKVSRKARKNRHFYITGDCHGDFKKIEFFANITIPARMMS